MVNTTGRAGHVAGLIGQHHWNTHSLPTHEKMVCLGNLLDTSPEQLRYGRSNEMTFVLDGYTPSAEDQQFFKRYLMLTKVQQRLIRDVTCEMSGVTTLS